MSKKIYIFLIILGVIISFIVLYTYDYLIIPTDQTVAKKINNKQQIDLDSLLLVGKESYYQGDLEKSLITYKQILTNEPENITAIQNLIIIYKELGRPKEAIKYFEQLITIQDDNLKWRSQFGITLYEIGEYSQAEGILSGVYSKIIELNKVNQKEKDFLRLNLSSREEALLYYYLGKTLCKNDRFKQAEEIFQLGINKASYLTLNYLGLAELYKKQNRLQEAISAYKKALAKDRNLSFIYPELAMSFEEMKEEKAAYYYWKKSYLTGNKAKLAKERIRTLTKKHPEFIQQALEEKNKARTKIKWVKIKPIAESTKIPLIKVGLIDKTSSITFQTGAPFIIKDKELNQIVLTGGAKEEWKIQLKNGKYIFFKQSQEVKTIKSTGSLILSLNDMSNTIALYDITYGQGYFWAGNEDRQYRGDIELFPITNNYFNVINRINLEEYLFSVVPAEMPAWWPEEALKSQIIAARSYALSNLGKHKANGYDLCSSVHCAVYKGVVSENRRTNQAVLSTQGEVCFYQDRIINAVFCSNSGGFSESSVDIWGEKLSYLNGANNMLNQDFIFPLEPYQLQEWLIDLSPSYASNSKYAGYNSYRWIKNLNKDYFLEKYNLKKLRNIIPLVRSKGGSIEKILIQGEDKEIILKKDQIRGKLGGLKSNRFFIEKIYDPEGTISQLIFYGSGWGHTVGLDQTATAGMAARGFNYHDIIKHFYQEGLIKKIY